MVGSQCTPRIAKSKRAALAVCMASFISMSAGAFADHADAYVVEPVVADNIPTIAQHVARGGAIDVPGATCGTVCSNWWLEEHRPIPNQPTSDQLHRELRAFRTTGTRVLPLLRTLNTIGLAVGTFELGWKIGEGIRAKWLGIDVPPRGETAGGHCGSRYGVSLKFYPAGSDLLFGAKTDEDGWVWGFAGYDPACGSGTNRWFQPNCKFTFPPAPAPYQTRSSSASTASCKVWPYTSWAPSEPVNPVSWGFLPENGTPDALNPSAPVEDYVAQPHTHTTTNWPGAPTSSSDLETRTRQALESGEYKLTESWYAHQLDPTNYDTGSKNDEDCDLSGGTTDPAPERGTEFELRYEPVPEGEYPSAGYATVHGTAHLRWGVTWPDVDNGEIQYGGWGFRKIKAKHGWSAADHEATMFALTLDLSPRPSEGPHAIDRWVFTGSEYAGRRGAWCRREVSVEFGRNLQEELAGMPAPGIMTSFGKRIN